MIHSAKFIRQGGEATYAETVQYHSVGPDSSKPRSLHVYSQTNDSSVYSYAKASWEGMATEGCVYENPVTNVSMHLIQFLYRSNKINVLMLYTLLHVIRKKWPMKRCLTQLDYMCKLL